MTSRGVGGLPGTSLLLCLGLILSACSSEDEASTSQTDGTSQSAATASRVAADVPYALFDGNVPAEGWRMSEAVQPNAEGLEMFGEMTPGMAWFAEWDGPDAADSAYLSLTMRNLSLADLNVREPLARAESGEINGRQASWGDDSPHVDEASGVVRIVWGDAWTLELRGSEPVDKLHSFAQRLRSASLPEWRTAGGQVGCAPFAEKCEG